ncbi:MAG: hypothetical protein OHK0019_25560 [Saprospiraceae bacterium]
MKNEKSTFSRPKIFHSEAVNEFMLNYLMDEKFETIRESIRAKTQTLDSENLSYRIINHWENEGLISDLRPSGKGWRKYSLIDRVWIEVIVELRRFGYPLEQIKKVKEDLVRAETDSLSSFPFLEVYFVLAFVFKEPCYLLVFPDGKTSLVISREYKISDELGIIGSHIKINLNELIQRIYPEKDLKPITRNSLELLPEEMELMLFVRTGNFESVTVKRKNGKIDFIEGTETLSADTRLTEIMKKQDYQEIQMKVAKGKTVGLKRTIKKRL